MTEQLSRWSQTDIPEDMSFAGSRSFQYGGSIGPLPIAPDTQRRLLELGQLLSGEFQLVGLFGVDFYSAPRCALAGGSESALHRFDRNPHARLGRTAYRLASGGLPRRAFAGGGTPHVRAIVGQSHFVCPRDLAVERSF